MTVLHAYDHLEEALSQIHMQQIMMREMELCMEILEEGVVVSEARIYTSDMMIDYVYHQVVQVIVLMFFLSWILVDDSSRDC